MTSAEDQISILEALAKKKILNPEARKAAEAKKLAEAEEAARMEAKKLAETQAAAEAEAKALAEIEIILGRFTDDQRKKIISKLN